MNKIKKVCFFAIGIGMIGTSSLLFNFKNQGLIYNKFLVEPTEIISSYISENSKNNLIKKQQYISWSEENKKFIKNILEKDLTENSDIFINNLDKLPIIIKIDNMIDKIGLFIHNKLENIIPNGMQEQNYLISVASGKNSIYLRQSITNTEVSEAIYIGLKEFQSKDSLLFKNLLRIFKGNERQIYDYVFFHELSHFISIKMYKNGQLNEDNMFKEIEMIIKKDSSNNNVIYDKENIDILLSQYSESIGDVMAIELLYKKYPELKKDNDLPYNLARLRTEEVIDIEHRTVGALIATQEYFKNNNVPDNMTDMLKVAHKSSLINVEYYSKPLLKDKKQYINFSNEEHKEKILSKIDTIREKILKEKHSINYLNYKI